MNAIAANVPPGAIIAFAFAWCMASATLEFGRQHVIARAFCLGCIAWICFALFKSAGQPEHAAALAAGVSLLCLGVAETDLRKRLIPDLLVLGLLVLSLSPWSALSWLDRAIGALALGAMFWVVREAHFRVRTMEGLGFGDVKLAATIGAVLGAQTGFFVVAIAAAILAALMIGLRQREPAPFGAGLGVSVIGAMFVQGAFL